MTDTYDRICKSTKYDTDSPCGHGAYNEYEGALDKDSCKSCDIGNSLFVKLKIGKFC